MSPYAFCQALTLDQVPRPSRAILQKSLLDILGTLAVAVSNATGQTLYGYARKHYPGGEFMSRLPFDGTPVNLLGAAWAGGFTGDSLDAHEGHFTSKGHAAPRSRHCWRWPMPCTPRAAVSAAATCPKPSASATKPARALYSDPEVCRQDLERLWHRDWIFAGHTFEIAKPGQYLTLQIGDYPVAVMRRKDGQVRAFHNACRRRGAKICEREQGKVAKRVCPYHRWTYEPDGSLLFAGKVNADFDRTLVAGDMVGGGSPAKWERGFGLGWARGKERGGRT